MATLRLYRCEKCGYEISTEDKGWYTTMMGCFFLFRCDHCHSIVTYTGEELAKGDVLECKNCGEHGGTLHSWNPVEGGCPKCGESLKEVKESVIFAD